MRPIRIAQISVWIATALVGGGVFYAMRCVPAGDVYPEGTESDLIMRRAPELGPNQFWLVPNLDRAEVVAPDRPHNPAEILDPDRKDRFTRRRTFAVSTNSLGLRGPEPPESPRVLCVGDSVTFGWGVRFEESYPHLLGIELGVDVINAGIPGLKPPEIGRVAGLMVERFPTVDLVLFMARPNHEDPRPIQSFVEAVREARLAVRPRRLAVVLPPIGSFDVRGNAGHDEEVAQLDAELKGVRFFDLAPVFRERRPGRGVVLEIAPGRQIVRDVADGGVVLDVAAPNDDLAPEVIDLFESDPAVHEPLIFDGGHPDAEGFVVMADELARWVRSTQLLEPRRQRRPAGRR